MAVVVISLQVFSDVRKCRKVFRVLCSAGNVTDFMFSNNILFKKKFSINLGIKRAIKGVVLDLHVAVLKYFRSFLVRQESTHPTCEITEVIGILTLSNDA